MKKYEWKVVKTNTSSLEEVLNYTEYDEYEVYQINFDSNSLSNLVTIVIFKEVSS